MSLDAQRAVQADYYDHNLGKYERTRKLDRSYVRKARIIHEAVGLPPAAVIEIGAGSGLLTYFLYDRLRPTRYVALDLSNEMTNAARERLAGRNVEFVIGDAQRPELPEQNFDAIVGVDVIHHLGDPVTALAAWHRLARPGGRLAVLESNAWNPLMISQIGVEHEVRAFLNTKANLEKWTRASGWHAVEVRPTPTFTPPGPAVLSPVFDVIDRVCVRVPKARNLCALWLVTATRATDDRRA